MYAPITLLQKVNQLQAQRQLHTLGSDMYIALTKRIQRLVDAHVAQVHR